MQLILPDGVEAEVFQQALTAFANVVGEDRVLSTDEDRETYLDLYAPGAEAEKEHAPSAAVVVDSVEQVQAIVKLANQYKIPLWPNSRGKNFGYGGSAPVMAGSVILDMGRMNKILEVDEKLAYCILEPGVGFFDLHEHLSENNIPLWMSIPGNGWGSVMGNALERGFSSTPYGEHSNSICGLEVVLPNGEIVRTGTGALEGSKSWPLFKNGFGPSWDHLFVQSNFGIVTKIGFWLMPASESTLTMSMALKDPDAIGWLVDVLTPLRIKGIIPHNVGIRNYMGSATTTSQRHEWYEGRDAIPDSVINAIMDRYNVGWWNFSITLHGHPDANEANRKVIEAAFAPHTDEEFSISTWKQGDSGRGGPPSPSVFALQIVNWHGGRGGHIGFSPILPSDGDEVVEQFRRTRSRYDEFGIDYSSTFYVCGRHTINVNLMLYNKDDDDMTQRTNSLFTTMIQDSKEAGFGEYRTHLSYMDDVAASYDFNEYALSNLNNSMKDMIDPNGIIAPGKSGIWPRRYREDDA